MSLFPVVNCRERREQLGHRCVAVNDKVEVERQHEPKNHAYGTKQRSKPHAIMSVIRSTTNNAVTK